MPRHCHVMMTSLILEVLSPLNKACRVMFGKLPDATLDVIAGAGHMACEKHAAAFNSVLLPRLARLVAVAAGGAKL